MNKLTTLKHKLIPAMPSCTFAPVWSVAYQNSIRGFEQDTNGSMKRPM